MLRKTPLKRGNYQLKRSPLKRVPLKKKPKTSEQLQEQKEKSDKINAFWEYCIANRVHVSQISGVRIHSIGKINFHHLYEKSPYPELKYSIGNILVVTSDEHANLNGDVEYYTVAKAQRRIIKMEWDKYIEQSKNWEIEYEDNLK